MRISRSFLAVAIIFLGAAHPAGAEGIGLFERLGGTWDVTYDIYNKDGSIHPFHGQVVYSRILNGAALQEIWTSDAHNPIPQPFSTTVGFYDAKHERWTAVTVFPAKGYTSIVSGGELNGRIVLTGRDADGTIQRWSIDEIQMDSFVYHFESSIDDGKTWKLLGLNHMHRQSI